MYQDLGQVLVNKYDPLSRALQSVTGNLEIKMIANTMCYVVC